MNGLTVVAALALISALALTSVDGQVYGYRVNVILGSSKFDSQDGKLKLTLKTSQSSHKIALSPETEKLSSNGRKSYTVAVPFPLEAIVKVAVEWSRKRTVKNPSGWFGKPKIYVDSVQLEPTYAISHS